MTLPSPPDAALDAILSRARHLILDFNGPVCRLYPDQSERLAADQLRAILTQHNAEIPDTIAAATDPLAVLAHAAATSPQLAEELDAELTRHEISAAIAAQPAGYSHDLDQHRPRRPSHCHRHQHLLSPRSPRVPRQS